jgi:hypothetical protein
MNTYRSTPKLRDDGALSLTGEGLHGHTYTLGQS